jgi:hypothetical protein
MKVKTKFTLGPPGATSHAILLLSVPDFDFQPKNISEGIYSLTGQIGSGCRLPQPRKESLHAVDIC